MVFYLKINREKSYVLPNLMHWIDSIKQRNDSHIFIICDNEELRRKVKRIIVEQSDIEIISSRFESELLTEILGRVTLGKWEKVGCAHLTTFLHSYENNIESYWNIDADDTYVCLDPIRVSEMFEIVEEDSKKNNIVLNGLDMWHSISKFEGWSDIPHWSFGITYTDNSINWISIIEEFSRSEEYKIMQKKHSNIDWFFTYITKASNLKIRSFYFNNMKFMHYYGDFFDYPHLGGFYHYTDHSILFPILQYCFGTRKMGEISISSDVLEYDMNIVDDESLMALISHSYEKGEFTDEIKGTGMIEVYKNKKILSYLNANGCKSFSVYGAGEYFLKYYDDIFSECKPAHIYDGNPNKWGKEVIDGIVCEEIKEIDNNSVYIITAESMVASFEIVKILISKGVNKIDHIDNLRQYLLGI